MNNSDVPYQNFSEKNNGLQVQSPLSQTKINNDPMTRAQKTKQRMTCFYFLFSSYYVALSSLIFCLFLTIVSLIMFIVFVGHMPSDLSIAPVVIFSLTGCFGFISTILLLYGVIIFQIAYCVCSCRKLGKKGLGVHHHLNIGEVEQYTLKMSKENNVGGGCIFVDCYHYETRTRTVTGTDANGNTTYRTETYQEKVSTFVHTFPIYYTTVNDNSTIPNLKVIESDLIEVKSILDIQPDPSTSAYLEKLVDDVKKVNAHRDTHIDCYRKKHSLPDFLKTIRFSKSGELPKEVSILENPCGSFSGFFCWITCCIFKMRASFLDKFIVTEYTIIKNVSINEEMRAKLTTEHTMGAINANEKLKLDKQMKQNQEILERNRQMLEQQQRMLAGNTSQISQNPNFSNDTNMPKQNNSSNIKIEFGDINVQDFGDMGDQV